MSTEETCPKCGKDTLREFIPDDKVVFNYGFDCVNEECDYAESSGVDEQ